MTVGSSFIFACSELFDLVFAYQQKGKEEHRRQVFAVRLFFLRLELVLQAVNQALEQNGGTLLEFIGDEAVRVQKCCVSSVCSPSQQRALLGTKGIASRSKDATRSSWPYY